MRGTVFDLATFLQGLCSDDRGFLVRCSTGWGVTSSADVAAALAAEFAPSTIDLCEPWVEASVNDRLRPGRPGRMEIMSIGLLGITLRVTEPDDLTWISAQTREHVPPRTAKRRAPLRVAQHNAAVS